MKKIRLNLTNSDATEILTRTQLKSIYGGTGSGSGGSGSNDNQISGCPTTKDRCTNDKTCKWDGIAGICGWSAVGNRCACATFH